MTIATWSGDKDSMVWETNRLIHYWEQLLTGDAVTITLAALR